MRRSLENVTISAGISVVVSILLLNWLVNDDATKSFFMPAVSEIKESGIASVQPDMNGKSVVLNVHLRRPMTCKEVINALPLEDLPPIRGKTYTPVCTIVNPTTVTITYKEVVKA